MLVLILGKKKKVIENKRLLQILRQSFIYL
jgi:hypothetical protein